MRKQAIIATLTVGVLFCAAIVQAGVERVRVKVDGLACPFCAYGIEKNLSKVAGVVSVRTDVSAGRVIVVMAAGRTLGRAAAERAVRDAGFTLAGFRRLPGGS